MIPETPDIGQTTCISLSNRFDKLTFSNYDDIAMIESNQNCIPDIEENDIVPIENNKRCRQSQDNAQPELLNDIDSTIENCSFKYSSKGLHMCNLNIRHILPKLDELKILMTSDKSPDIVGLCETFLTDSISENQLYIDDFDIIRKDRSNIEDKSGGGVMLYTRKSLCCKRRSEFETNQIESIWAEIAVRNSKSFLICSVYRPPNSPSGWIDKFEEEISMAQTTGLEIILMGDFNIEFRSCTNNKWLNLIQLFDLSQIIQQPTRVTEKSSTLIDHVYTSNPENIIECFVPVYSISDHFPVCFTRKINSKIPKSKHVLKSYRCFKNFDENSFLSDLSEDMNNFSADKPDINHDMQLWYSLVLKQLDKHAPVKHKRVKTSRLPEWLNEDIINAQKQRDNCKRLKQWSQYKKYRNKVTTLIRQSKRNHFSDSISNLKDTKTIWKHLKSVSNPGESNNHIPDEIVINNVTFTTTEQVASKLNKFFTSISELLINSDTDDTTPDLNNLVRFIQSKVPQDVHFKIPRITPSQVVAFINALDPTKATGVDGLGPKILKMAVQILSPSIAVLINKSLDTGAFPDQLKLAKVFPIFKGGCKTDPSNYRPISILPTLSKLFEKHINKHLMAYLNKYRLIHESQSGFRQKHSCQTALVKLIDQWMTCIDQGDLVGALFVDFKKAFDLVDHAILLEKLSLYKFHPLSLQWFVSYLNCRKQTIVSDSNTEYANIKTGVPQGSILGPTLFLLFINDLPLFINNCYSDLFADDATVHTHSPSIQDIGTKLQTSLNRTVTWSFQHKMRVHLGKTKYMVIGNKNRNNDLPDLVLQCDETFIERVSKQKLLGIYIDENLSWNPQIDYLCSLISSRISLLKQLSKYVSKEAQKMFYSGYILPLVDYGSNTWGTTTSTNIDRLLKLQKRAARIILQADFTTPSTLMFSELGWQSVPKRILYNKAVLTYKAINNMTPEYISDLLTPMSMAHVRSLRSSDNGTLKVPRSRSALFDRSFSYSAPKLWNNLPQTVRESTSLHIFKNQVINYI